MITPGVGSGSPAPSPDHSVAKTAPASSKPISKQAQAFKEKVISLARANLDSEWINADLTVENKGAQKADGKRKLGLMDRLRKGKPSDRIQKAVKLLNKETQKYQEELKNDKEFANALLIARQNINEKLVKGKKTAQTETSKTGKLQDANKREALQSGLKEVKANALAAFDGEKITLQKDQVKQLKAGLQNNEKNIREFMKKEHYSNEEIDSAITFLKDKINYYEGQLAKGKPVVIPKWYHCTHIVDKGGAIPLLQILNSGGINPERGENSKNTAVDNVRAWVSSKPELGRYGDGVLVMGDAIEDLAKLEPQYTPKIDEQRPEYERNAAWQGFQERINLNYQSKKADPISYYFHRTLAFVSYKPSEEKEIDEQDVEKAIEPLKKREDKPSADGTIKKRDVEYIPFHQMKAFNILYNLTFSPTEKTRKFK